MSKQKTNEKFTTTEHDNYISIHCPKVTYYLNNCFIPFGMNDNYTMKLEFTQHNIDIFESIKKKEKDFFNNAKYILHKDHSIESPRLNSKLQKKGRYPPTILCSVYQRNNTIQSILKQKARKLNTFYTLQRKRVNAQIECDTIWFNKKSQGMNCYWKINYVEVI